MAAGSNAPARRPAAIRAARETGAHRVVSIEVVFLAIFGVVIFELVNPWRVWNDMEKRSGNFLDAVERANTPGTFLAKCLGYGVGITLMVFGYVAAVFVVMITATFSYVEFYLRNSQNSD